MAIYHMSIRMLSRSTRNTIGAAAYRSGCKLFDAQTEKSFDFRNKPVQHVEFLLPEGAPEWAKDVQDEIRQDRQKGVQRFVDVVEAAEKRKDSQVYREIEFALPQEFTDEQNVALAKEFLEDQCCRLGISVLANFHFDTDEETGERKPHCHALLLTRRLEEHGLAAHKERAWNAKAQAMQWREQWAAYANFHLQMHGFEARIDHRSNAARGIELEPQPKLGKGVKEYERRLQELENGPEGDAKPRPFLDKVAAFQEVKLRNLYRIVKRPDVVLEIATKNHATFMWGDVTKILARYVDDRAVFRKLGEKLKASSELVLLRTIKVKSDGGGLEDAPVYTTRAMLKAELNLVRLGESLAERRSHPVTQDHIERVIAAYDQDLAEHGGLSDDQKAAIIHVTKGDQLSCVVGYAGAGKTTALKAAKEIWKAEGYQVYGLAPTGKAARNLEQLGIPSQTLHKFLREFESGRNRYAPDSILMLDEGGMVDTGCFEAFLRCAEALGVKAVVVGDSVQLQPVEAGAPLRLVTKGAGVVRLETVVRQKEEWQKEATKLFGQLKTAEAVEAYYKRGCMEFVEQWQAPPHTFANAGDYKGLVEGYNLSRRVAGNIFRTILEDIEAFEEVRGRKLDAEETAKAVLRHQDYLLYRSWKGTRKSFCEPILHLHLEACKPYMKELGVDPVAFGAMFSDPELSSGERLQEGYELAVERGFPRLDPGQDRHVCDVRAKAKEALIKAFLTSLKEHPGETHLMFAYTNKDVRSLNEEVRALLKQEGKIGKEEYAFTVHRERDNDFRDKVVFKEERRFSVGDRLLFTRNDNGLGVNNGSLGTVTALNRAKIQATLDGSDKTVSFSPRLYPFFDQGWAATIDKTQGSDADRCFLLASREMHRNLSYVGMTRHKISLKVFASTLDFWRDELMVDKLSDMNEKLMGVDYVDHGDAFALMKEDDRLLTRALRRIGNELQAIKCVSKRGWQEICIQFLGKSHKGFIGFSIHESLSEAERAKLLEEEKEEFQAAPNVPEELAELAAFNTGHGIGSPGQEGAQLGAEKFSVSNAIETVKPDPQEKPSLTRRVAQTQAGSELRALFKDHIVKTQDRELDKKDLKLVDKVARNLTEQVVSFRAHAQKEPQKEELQTLMMRAIYEERRIPRIEKAHVRAWKEQTDKPIPAAERPKARAYAERVAMIEGRLYGQALQEGKKPPSSRMLNRLACEELAQNQKRQTKDAKTYQAELGLSEYAGSRMANEVLRHQERYGVKPTAQQTEILKAGVCYQEQRMTTLKSEMKEGLSKKPDKQDAARINAVAEYVTRREFEAFKRHAFETGKFADHQQLRQLQNEVRAEYRKTMKPEVDKLMREEDRAKQRGRDGRLR